MCPLPASILIPTRGRPAYLDVALASIVPQAQEAGAEVVVIDDGVDPRTADVAGRHGARILPGAGQGANAARNAGIAATDSPLVLLVDDDVRAPAGWLRAHLDGADGYPDEDVFGGPIRAQLERGPRSCGRESAPITTLDLGDRDRPADLVWSANMAIRRRALVAVGGFDEGIHGRGEEEEWQERYRARGGRIRYLAAAGLDHRRVPQDARLRALARAEYALGRSARRNDVRKAGAAPSALAEAALVAGCLGHAARHRCPLMLATAAHAAGRLREAVRR